LTTNGKPFTIHSQEITQGSAEAPLRTVGSSSKFTLTDYNMDFIKKVSEGMWGKSILEVSLDETTETVIKPAEVTNIPITKFSRSKDLFDEKSLMSGYSATSSELIRNMKFRLFNTVLTANDVIAIPGVGCGMLINVEQGGGQMSGTKSDGLYIISYVSHNYRMEDGSMEYSQNIGLVREGNI
jgi:hypothetical protein